MNTNNNETFCQKKVQVYLKETFKHTPKNLQNVLFFSQNSFKIYFFTFCIFFTLKCPDIVQLDQEDQMMTFEGFKDDQFYTLHCFFH